MIFFLGVISIERVVVPSPKIFINFPRNYEKIILFRFSSWRDPLVQTRHTGAGPVTIRSKSVHRSWETYIGHYEQ